MSFSSLAVVLGLIGLASLAFGLLLRRARGGRGAPNDTAAGGHERPSFDALPRPTLPPPPMPSDEPPRAWRPASSSVVSAEMDIAELGLFDDLSDEAPTGAGVLASITAVGRTDAGRRRKHNEDAFLLLPLHGVFAVADGMGGDEGGEVASQLAMDALATAFETRRFLGSPLPGLPRRGDELVRAIHEANRAILEQARSNDAQSGMGSTVVAVRFTPDRSRLYVAHVGDSRLYRYRDGQLEALTADHVLGTMGITGPSAQKLSRAVGVFAVVEVELGHDAPRVGDLYLLCSDGLTKMVPDDRLAELLRDATTLETTVDALVREANERGGKDNITAVLLRIDEPPT